MQQQFKTHSIMDTIRKGKTVPVNFTSKNVQQQNEELFLSLSLLPIAIRVRRMMRPKVTKPNKDMIHITARLHRHS
jgi:hypothetical protein